MIRSILGFALVALLAPPMGERELPPPSRESAYRRARYLQREVNLNDALRLTDAQLAGFGASRPPLYFEFRLLKSELLTSLLRRAEAARLRDEPIPDVPENAASIARQKRLQAAALGAAGKFAEAQSLLDAAAALAANGQDREIIPSIDRARGDLLRRMNRPEPAEAIYREGVRAAAETGDSRGGALARGLLGTMARDAARYDEAAGWFEQAVSESNSKSILAFTKLNLGWSNYRLGDFDRALALLNESAAIAREMGDLDKEQMAIGDTGAVHHSTGNVRAALDDYARALELARRVGNQLFAVKWLNNLAALSLDTGDLAAASRYNAEAMTARERVSDPATALWPVINAGRILQQTGDAAAAEMLYRQAIAVEMEDPGPRLEARERLAGLLASQGRVEEAESQFRLALGLVDDSRARLEREDSKLSYFASVIQLHQEYVEFLLAHGRNEEALLVADASRARVLSENRREGAGARESIASLRDASRRAGAILLSYWLAPERSVLWLISPTEVRTVNLPARDAIRELVEAHAKSILDLRDPLDSSEPPGRKLYQQLIAPVAACIPAGARVAIVPDGALHDLNFETLIVGAGSKPHYWIEDVTISVAPSLGAMLNTPRAARGYAALLLIGDPIPGGDRRFPRLAHARREIESIRDQFAGSEIVMRTGDAARVSAYHDANPLRFSIIHFAAHGAANRERPLDSAVILTPAADGQKLYAREILRQPIRADLVTISACRSAGARTYGGEGLVGFAWAFLKAGARNVVAGLWEVDDDSTAGIMTRMYGEIHGGATPAAALRAAKLKMLQSRDAVRKPYYWAPFQTFTASL